jgi:hypothetical protein
MTKLNTIEEALIDLKLGRMIIVVDDENRENEGDFVMCADMITPEAVNFMATFGRGMICAPITQEIADRLELPLQANLNNAPLGTAFTVTVDAIEGVSTGISAKERAIKPCEKAPRLGRIKEPGTSKARLHSGHRKHGIFRKQHVVCELKLWRIMWMWSSLLDDLKNNPVNQNNISLGIRFDWN